MVHFNFTVVPGHQVASGLASNSPYPNGTIALQKPFFLASGLDLSAIFCGTINAQLNCQKIRLIRWDHECQQVKWLKDVPAEDFRFAKCTIIRCKVRYCAYIYHVVAVSKVDHFQADNVLELLAPKIADLKYGDICTLEMNENMLELFN